jgi:hypothetical protein
VNLDSGRHIQSRPSVYEGRYLDSYRVELIERG